MKAKLSRLCMALVVFCLSLVLFGGVERASAADAKDRGLAYIGGVSCIYEEPDRYKQFEVMEILPEYKSLEEYIKFGHGDGYEYYNVRCSGNGQTYSDETCVTIYAKSGAEVSYSKGSKMKLAGEPDYYNKETGYCVYYFHVPYKTVKNGGTFTASAELDGEKKELKVVFAKPEKKSVKWSKKVKATIVASEDDGYGVISLSMDNKEVERIPIDYEDVRDGAKVEVWPEIRIGTCSVIYMRPEFDYEKGEDVYVEEKYDQPISLYDLSFARGDGIYRIKETEHYVALDGTPTDTEWRIKSLIWSVNIKTPSLKVKIPAQKAAPKVKIDMIKEKIGISTKMQYYVGLPVVKDGEVIYSYSEWTDGKKGMTLGDLGDMTSGAVVYVRIKGAKGKIPSATRYIDIPSRQAIDITKVSAEGAVTQCAIKISDLDKAKNPYEYTCAEPTKTTKWKTLKTGSVNLKKTEVNETTPVIYVRQKALNENKKNNIELRQASTIAVLTYDSTDNKWTASAWDMSKLK